MNVELREHVRDAGDVLYLASYTVGWGWLPLLIGSRYLLAWMDAEVDVGILLKGWDVLVSSVP
jgi:hypothetical protein